MSFNPLSIRSDFPALDTGIAFFDGPGGSQVPKSVGQAISDAITQATSNRGLITYSEQNAERCVQEYRNAVADLVNCDPQGVIYGRSWTQLIYDLSRSLAKHWNPGDEIIVSRLDHDSNIRPWIQAAQPKGVNIRWAEFERSTGEMPINAVTDLLNSRTKLVALTGAANTLGTRPDIEAIGSAVQANGSLFIVDGVHLTPHSVIDFKELPADFFGFSSYKLFGPHCATLVADPALLSELKNDKLLPSTNVVPEKFELGTLPYELMAGVTASIDYLAGLDSQPGESRRQKIVQSMQSVEKYEEQLFSYLESGIASIPNIEIYGHATNRTPTLYFNISGVPGIEIHKFLSTKKVNAPAHNFYAYEVSHALGLGDTGAVRTGLAPYSIKEDVDRLINGLKEFIDYRTK